MTYVSKFFLHPPSFDNERVEELKKFLDRELPVPRESFGSEVIPVIYEFFTKHYSGSRAEIYIEGSKEQEGFEIFLNENAQNFNEGKFQRIRVIYRKEGNQD